MPKTKSDTERLEEEIKKMLKNAKVAFSNPRQNNPQQGPTKMAEQKEAR